MSVDLFAGVSVRDYTAALTWYEALLGTTPSFYPNDVEAVWQMTDHSHLYVQHRPDHAGHALVTLFVDDLDEQIAAIAARGLQPALDETYDNGVRKVTYRDPDGNEIGLGGTGRRESASLGRSTP